jgi:hypothetical protein
VTRRAGTNNAKVTCDSSQNKFRQQPQPTHPRTHTSLTTPISLKCSTEASVQFSKTSAHDLESLTRYLRNPVRRARRIPTQTSVTSLPQPDSPRTFSKIFPKQLTTVSRTTVQCIAGKYFHLIHNVKIQDPPLSLRIFPLRPVASQ